MDLWFLRFQPWIKSWLQSVRAPPLPNLEGEHGPCLSPHNVNSVPPSCFCPLSWNQAVCEMAVSANSFICMVTLCFWFWSPFAGCVWIKTVVNCMENVLCCGRGVSHEMELYPHVGPHEGSVLTWTVHIKSFIQQKRSQQLLSFMYHD